MTPDRTDETGTPPADRHDPATAPPDAQHHAPLLDDREADAYLQRWSDVQSEFVDDPRGAVRSADALVGEVVDALSARFAAHGRELESHWNRGDEPGTEQLRRALQQYRSFFDRLLST